MINLDEIELKPTTKRHFEAIKRALKVRQIIFENLGLRAEVRLHTNGAVVHVSPGKDADMERARDRAHSISKLLDIQLNKDVTSSNLLKYVALLGEGVRFYMNTRQCFYGGEATIEHFQRSKAHCKPKEDNEN